MLMLPFPGCEGGEGGKRNGVGGGSLDLSDNVLQLVHFCAKGPPQTGTKRCKIEPEILPKFSAESDFVGPEAITPNFFETTDTDALVGGTRKGPNRENLLTITIQCCVDTFNRSNVERKNCR